MVTGHGCGMRVDTGTQHSRLNEVWVAPASLAECPAEPLLDFSLQIVRFSANKDALRQTKYVALGVSWRYFFATSCACIFHLL